MSGVSSPGDTRARAVDLDAETWPVRDPDDAALVLDRLAQDRLADRVLGPVELPHVCQVANAMGIGHSSDLQTLRKAARRAARMARS